MPPQGINRKKFLLMTASGVAVCGSLNASTWTTSAEAPETRERWVVVRPSPGKKYSRSFLKLCRERRFRSALEAVRHIRDRRIGYELAVLED
jgi:hypothetical protein